MLTWIFNRELVETQENKAWSLLLDISRVLNIEWHSWNHPNWWYWQRLPAFTKCYRVKNARKPIYKKEALPYTQLHGAATSKLIISSSSHCTSIHCTVLLPGKFTNIILQPLPVYSVHGAATWRIHCLSIHCMVLLAGEFTACLFTAWRSHLANLLISFSIHCLSIHCMALLSSSIHCPSLTACRRQL